MHGDFDKLEVLMFCHTLTVRTVKSVRSIRGSALVHIIKDAMPVSFRSDLFTPYNLTIFKQ